MTRHAPGDRVDRVTHVDALLLQQLAQVAHVVLGLRDREPVAGDEDDAPCVGEHHRDVVSGRGPHVSAVAGSSSRSGRRLGSERTEEGLAQRPAHPAAHHDREQRSRGADESPADDQGRVVQHETGGGRGEARARVQQRDDDRHVGAPDRQHEQVAEQEPADEEQREPDAALGRRRQDDQCAEREPERGVDEVLPREHDRLTGEDVLQLPEGDQAAPEADGADQRREEDADQELASQPVRIRRVPVELGGRDQCRSTAADPVEERDHLRDRGHLHRPRGEDADHRPDGDPGEDQPVLVDLLAREREPDGDRHADRGDPVPRPRRARVREPLDADDEQDRRHQVGEVDPGLTHPADLPGVA